MALLLPVASIGGRLSSGWLCDKVGRKQVLATGFALMTAGMLIFGYVTTGNMWLLTPFIITFSLGWGFVVTTRIALLRDYFGRGSFGTILGLIMGAMMLGNMLGAPLAGWVFDAWGSYQGAWLGFSAITTTAVFLVLTIPLKTK